MCIRDRAKAAEEEIISTAKIESIDYNRDSVRSILKGLSLIHICNKRQRSKGKGKFLL